MPKLMSFSGTVLKNLFSKPATTSYPAEPAVYPERTRGHVEIAIEDCIMCGMCMRVCPPGAIKVDKAKGTWEIERFDCVQCGYCVEKCPKKCLKIVPGYPTPGVEKTKDVVQQERKEEPAATAPAGGKPQVDKNVCVYCTLCAKKCPAGAISVDRAAKTWELNEEACISCGLCASSCPKKCLTMAAEGEAKKEEPAAPADGIPQVNKDVCVYCTLCAKKCPASAITVDRAAKTWELDQDSCMSCGLCASSCPKKCLTMVAR